MLPATTAINGRKCWMQMLSRFSNNNGIYDQATAESFRKNILEKGGSEHPMILYKRFRGQEPTVDALLERSGLKSKSE